MIKTQKLKLLHTFQRHNLKILLVLIAFALFAVGAWVVVRQRSAADESDSRLAANEQVFRPQNTLGSAQDISQNQSTILNSQPLLISGAFVTTGLVLMVIGLVW